jgi:hypothetical protein
MFPNEVMPAKPTHSSAGHLPGMGKMQPAVVKPMEDSGMAETAAEEVLEGRYREGKGGRLRLADPKFAFMCSWHRLPPESVSGLPAPS